MVAGRSDSRWRALVLKAIPAALAAVLGAHILQERLGGAPERAEADGEAVAVWSNVGGCGSGGGGAAAGAGKWIGRGVSGGLVDVEVLSNTTLGGDYHYRAQALSSTFHFPNHPAWTVGLA